ncbi:MAG TPA: helix-turn-helix transcriptional regulator [Pirellulales bacterium]|nr:helix-turn-helix transcriptional regulator [Pirellulales bacterium]
MSIADWNPAALEGAPEVEHNGHKTICEETSGREMRSEIELEVVSPQRPLHRLSTVRKQQGISQRNVARRLGVDVATVNEQEQEEADLPLSVVYAWQRVLDVPVAELLVDSDAPLSPPVMERARLVKLMKTAAAIMEKAHSNALKRLVTMMVEQLLEIMPELRDVSAWHTIGQRRTLDDYGRAVERQLPDDLLRRMSR